MVIWQWGGWNGQIVILPISKDWPLYEYEYHNLFNVKTLYTPQKAMLSGEYVDVLYHLELIVLNHFVYLFINFEGWSGCLIYQHSSWLNFLHGNSYAYPMNCLWIKALGLGQGCTRPAGRAPGRPSTRAEIVYLTSHCSCGWLFLTGQKSHPCRRVTFLTG